MLSRPQPKPNRRLLRLGLRLLHAFQHAVDVMPRGLVLEAIEEGQVLREVARIQAERARDGDQGDGNARDKSPELSNAFHVHRLCCIASPVNRAE